MSGIKNYWRRRKASQSMSAQAQCSCQHTCCAKEGKKKLLDVSNYVSLLLGALLSLAVQYASARYGLVQSKPDLTVQTKAAQNQLPAPSLPKILRHSPKSAPPKKPEFPNPKKREADSAEDMAIRSTSINTATLTSDPYQDARDVQFTVEAPKGCRLQKLEPETVPNGHAPFMKLQESTLNNAPDTRLWRVGFMAKGETLIVKYVTTCTSYLPSLKLVVRVSKETCSPHEISQIRLTPEVSSASDAVIKVRPIIPAISGAFLARTSDDMVAVDGSTIRMDGSTVALGDSTVALEPSGQYTLPFVATDLVGNTTTVQEVIVVNVDRSASFQGNHFPISLDASLENLTYLELNHRITTNQASFYVYKSTDSGFNHGFPSGLFALSFQTRSLDGATVIGEGYDLMTAPMLEFDARSPNGARRQLGNQTFGVMALNQATRNMTTVYESALIELSLLRGTVDDKANARKITDALDYALNHDNLGSLAIQPVGLHSAYESGDIALLNNDLSPHSLNQGKTTEDKVDIFAAPILLARIEAFRGNTNTMQGSDMPALVNGCLQIPFQCIPERAGLAAANWAIYTNRESTFTPASPSSTSRVPTLRIVDIPTSGIVACLANRCLFLSGRTSGLPLKVRLLKDGGAHVTLTSTVDPSDSDPYKDADCDAQQPRLKVKLLDSGGARLAITTASSGSFPLNPPASIPCAIHRRLRSPEFARRNTE